MSTTNPPTTATPETKKKKAPPKLSARRQGLHRFVRQVSGLSTKQWILLRRTPLAAICQLCVPLICIIIVTAGIISDNVWSGAYAGAAGEGGGPEVFISPTGCYEDDDCFTFIGGYNWTGYAPPVAWSRIQVTGPARDTAGAREVREASPSSAGFLVDNLPARRWVPEPQFGYRDRYAANGTYLGYQEVCVEFCGDFFNSGFGNATMYSPSVLQSDDSLQSVVSARPAARNRAESDAGYGSVFFPLYDLPDTVMNLQNVDLAAKRLSWSAWVDSNDYSLAGVARRCYGAPPGDYYDDFYSDFDDDDEDELFDSEHLPIDGGCAHLLAKQDMHTALGREWSGNSDFLLVGGSATAPLIVELDDDSFAWGGMVQAITFVTAGPLSFAVLLPLIMAEVIKERQEGLRELMAMNGLGQKAYWIAQFGWNFGFHSFIALTLWMCCWVADLNCMRGGSITMLFLLLGSGPPMVTFAYAMAQLFKSIRRATFFGFTYIILYASFGYLINAEFWNLSSAMPTFLMLLPHYAFQRVLHLFAASYFEGRTPYPESSQRDGDWGRGIWYLVFDTLLYAAITLYADSVFKHGIGTGKSPLYPVYWAMSAMGLSDDPEAKANASTEEAMVGMLDESSAEKSGDGEDPDVAAERQAIQSGSINPKSPLVVRGLRKVYGSSGGAPPKVALDGMFLHMEPDEVLCLLGPNGSGKTTMMSVLVGVHQASGGSANVAGFDMATQMKAVRARLGVVQQFDVLFDKLTALETCLFFCRIQGLSVFEEVRVARSALKLVGLSNDLDTKAKDLSGGMRRRLSIAIAICGKPKLIFMDEPTTGLDPETRRALWDIIQELKDKSSIMLTTHMMDEADALADRVAIMTKGKLTAIGTAQHLKNRFGQGYAMSLNYIAGAREAAIAFVHSVAPTANVVSEYPGSLTFQIAPPVVVSSIFEAMETSRHLHGIRTWGINQASLEDVFLNIVTDEDLDGAEAPSGQAAPVEMTPVE